MEFFNKKEDVLDFKLTEYGKYLLAIGRLKPSYYAFFDDDVLYDVTGLGMSENPSMAKARIQSETPSLKVMPTRTGAEGRVKSFVQQVTDLLGPNSDPANNVEIFSRVEVFEEKGKINAHPIGRSSFDSRHNPAWAVEVLSTPEISSSILYLNDAGRIENIPQLTIDVDYKMFFSNGEQPDTRTIDLGESSIFLSVEDNYLMLEVLEKNTDFEKENFDIEVYHSGSDGKYVQLSYTPSDTSTFVVPLPIENDLNIPGNVEYYFNVTVDGDIPDFIYNKMNIGQRAISTNTSRLRLSRDIYTTDPEEPC
tara:strand:+ start:43281 stop:44204 length:924 start_codon:yes stop_codon:yes gene_type:complete